MKRIEDVNVLVIGDIMLDEYIIGNVERISPEAPVPIVNIIERTYSLGGCGNVVDNIIKMGANATCVCTIGDDAVGSKISKLLNDTVEDFALARINGIKSTHKARIISDVRMMQMLRVDEEDTRSTLPFETNKKIEERLLDCLNSIDFKKFDMILISDYAKLTICKAVMNWVYGTCIKVIVDPKPVNAYLYKDIFAITPNYHEYNKMIFSEHMLASNLQYIITTLGGDGLQIHDMGDDSVKHIDTESVEVYNVSGAGDTIIAALGICIPMGIDIVQSCRIANDCARKVVQSFETSAVSKDEFKDIIATHLD